MIIFHHYIQQREDEHLSLNVSNISIVKWIYEMFMLKTVNVSMIIMSE